MTVLNGILFPLTVDTISIENIIVTDGIMTLHAPPSRYTCNVWSYVFYDMTLATE